jgi:hypothetical protein
MKAKDMLLGRRYTFTNNNIKRKFKVIQRNNQNNGYLVNMIVKNADGNLQLSDEMVLVADGLEVEALTWGKKRLDKEQLDKVITHIKCGDWYKEQKAYIVFLINGIKYKLYYIAQKVLVRDIIGDIKPEKQYKNGYYAYSVSDLFKHIMEIDL